MRSKRRFHKDRVKKKARKVARLHHGYLDDYGEDLGPYEKMYEKIADNLKDCQHAGCGNVRRNKWEKERRTRQEIAADMKLQEYK